MSAPYSLSCTCGQLGYISRKAGRTALRSHPDRRGLRVAECEATGLWHIRRPSDEEQLLDMPVMPIAEVQRLFAAIKAPAAPASSPTKAA